MPIGITLGIQRPKVSAVIGTTLPVPGDTEMGIFVPNGIFQQQAVGDLHHLYRYAKTNIETVVPAGGCSKPEGGAEGSIVLGGAGGIALVTGAGVNTKSHMLHRTFIRLVELLNEQQKVN